MNDAWKCLFPALGNSGLPLFAGGKVTALTQNDRNICADVDGFAVEILLDGEGNPVQMRCPCPRTHELCPHMAAVLYAIEKPVDCWSNELERLMSRYYEPGFCDPLDGFELMEDIKAAVIHLLREPDANGWKAICKVYLFSRERCNSQRCIDTSFHTLPGFAEKALCIIFERLSAQDKAQMRSWLLQSDAGAQTSHITGLLGSNAIPKTEAEMDAWIQSLLH